MMYRLSTVFIYTERNFERKMKFNVLYYIPVCIKCNQIWHKQRIIHDTMHGNNKSVGKSRVDTMRGPFQ